MTCAIDWGRIDLVVFDVDGTLYDARRLRLLMAGWLLADAARHRSLGALRALSAFRRMREALADGDAGPAEAAHPVAAATPASPRVPGTPNDSARAAGVDFQRLQYLLPAQSLGMRPLALQALVEDWMEQRPLRWLAACRRPGVQAVFAGLRARGIRVAALSDYPARDKLAALGLRADPVVWAGDPGVGRLKPDPRGLRQLLSRTGVEAARTLVVGDRAERDGEVARRVGARAVLVGHPPREARRVPAGGGWPWVRDFEDALFAPLRQPPTRWAAA